MKKILTVFSVLILFSGVKEAKAQIDHLIEQYKKHEKQIYAQAAKQLCRGIDKIERKQFNRQFGKNALDSLNLYPTTELFFPPKTQLDTTGVVSNFRFFKFFNDYRSSSVFAEYKEELVGTNNYEPHQNKYFTSLYYEKSFAPPRELEQYLAFIKELKPDMVFTVRNTGLGTMLIKNGELLFITQRYNAGNVDLQYSAVPLEQYLKERKVNDWKKLFWYSK